ncbi:hypothetical protein [Saccharothrix longispora]|uniref:hypothetical protein n=1 Tax=Saccharothrix longispora TaxID=33920 RepID=UPI0028FD46B0|nr:hypothetical protein [Saccharothrix longispora]MBY8851132.1 hypothetical protein [Saccharothrix sp. MB29]MDU0291727.1 hypothetical protein [Saccharothrix longispora]
MSRVDWEPFIESLHEAAGVWDRTLACRADFGVALGDEDPPRVVPITEEQAERLMRAVAFLARRLGAATESVVYATAERRLAGDDRDPGVEADALSLTALHAAAMRHAADLASAASTRAEPRRDAPEVIPDAPASVSGIVPEIIPEIVPEVVPADVPAGTRSDAA